MLKVLRDNLKQLAWILWLVIAALVILIFVDFGSARAPLSSPTSGAATVGGELISYGAFQRQYQLLEDNYRSLYGESFSDELAEQLRLPIQALDTLIARKILVAEARSLNIRVSDEELRQAILEVPGLTDEEGAFIGSDEYANRLRRIGYTVAEFEGGRRDDLLIEQLTDILAETVYISDAEVERTSRERAELASIRYLRVSPHQFRDEVTVEEAELRDAFDADREAYRLPEQRIVRYLLVKQNALRATLEVSDDEIRRYHEENLAQFTRQEQVRARHILLLENEERSKAAARGQLDQIRRRIERGEDFAALAAEFSEDEATRQRGGELGFFARGRMTPAFEDVAFNANPGDLLGPIETSLGPQTGFHLIEIQDKREGGVQPLDEARDRIRNRLLTDKARVAAEAKARELAARIAAEGLASEQALRTLAELEQVDFQVTAPFGVDDNLPGIGRSTSFSSAAFDLQADRISEPVQIPAGWAILSLAEIVPPRIPELSEIEDQVRAKLVEERQRLAATERLTHWRREIDGGKSIEDAARELGVELQESGEFGKRGVVRGIGNNESIVAAALAGEVGEVAGPFETDQGPVLLEVVERKHWDRETFQEEKETTREELESRRVNSLLMSVVERRRTELGVHYNPQLLANFGLGEAVS
jgi:peptidyl-prolyl cis-trans isomerase D